MALETTISTRHIKERLINLREYNPGFGPGVYKFAERLANRLHLEIVPQGFYIAATLLLEDIKNKVDGITKQPIDPCEIFTSLNKTKLEFLPILVDNIHSMIPEIARAVCPKDFADDVERFYKDNLAGA